MSVPFEIRAYEPTHADGTERDRPFVTSGWLRSYERAHHTAKARHKPYLTHENRQLGALLRDAYYVQHGRVVNELLDTSTVLVAHFEGDADNLLGFACGERHQPGGVAVVHYVYVKGTWRQNGVARGLVDELLTLLRVGTERVVCSHAPSTDHPARPVMERLGWPLVPYPAFVDRHGRSAA